MVNSHITLDRVAVGSRFERLYEDDRPRDHRTDGQRDRDRILHSTALRRLSTITQVAAASEHHVFHNRLTHTLKVAQIGQRLAEFLLEIQPDVAEGLGGIDPDVVEAAALAHDLGHPPFGHVAETKLDELVRTSGNPAGFEGNPQSFRIVTKLALRNHRFHGLNLTRATLNAILKYPWLRAHDGGIPERKWGVYTTEAPEFHWVQQTQGRRGVKCAEAEIMDWADDIAYAVHDVEDFYRTGLIPLDRLIVDSTEVDRFLSKVFARWKREGYQEGLDNQDGLACAFRSILQHAREYPDIMVRHEGTRSQRASLRSLSAELISTFITEAIRLRTPDASNSRCVDIVPEHYLAIRILKELTREYVINNPALATQQYGQRRIISELFEICLEEALGNQSGIFPPSVAEQVLEIKESPHSDNKHDLVRVIADYISGMTEQQLIETHKRLTGVALGSVLDSPFY